MTRQFDLEREIRNARDDAVLDAWTQAFARGEVTAESYPYETWKRRYFPPDATGPFIIVSTRP
jgi:hypothetical protein